MAARIVEGSDWRLSVGGSASSPAGRKARRGPGEASAAPLGPLERLLAEEEGIAIEAIGTAEPRRRRGGGGEPLEIEVDGRRDQRAVLIARHASGAVSFVAPVLGRARGAGKQESSRFSLTMPSGGPARRGVLGEAVKLVVAWIGDQLVDQVVSVGLSAAARLGESAWWKRRGMREGLHQVTGFGSGAAKIRLRPSGAISGGRALLLLHGTFSDTLGSFGGLLGSSRLAALARTYPGGVHALEHFTVSRSVEDNARALLDALPDGETEFDVVAYSRGGLVLRVLAEQPDRFGDAGRKFRLRHGVLVAAPNAGTPLATGSRWEDTLGFVANLAEALPDNPLTSGLDFVSSGLVWLAGHLTGDLPGIAAMDADGPVIASLQEGAGPLTGGYSAVSANFHPDGALWRRLVDAGIDGFFGGANDLVVPTAGGWRVDQTAAAPGAVPAERVGCFGLDGNLRAHAGGVHHLNLLTQPETAEFVARACEGRAQDLPLLDLTHALRTRRGFRGGATEALSAEATATRTEASAAPPRRREEGVARRASAASPGLDASISPRAGARDRTLHLLIIGAQDQRRQAQILAMYGNARVIEPFQIGGRDRTQVGREAGARFRAIIDDHNRIRLNLEGRVDRRTLEVPELPDDEQLRDFGARMFEALFVGTVRRLYDLARSEQRAEPLNVVFTCEVPWIAELPWEFAFDRVRRKFLATEEIHFVRNVLTAVPAQFGGERPSRLRLLLVEAQPIGTAELSVDDEERLIRHQFHALSASGLVAIDALPSATPASLHLMILEAWLARRPYDVVHFMGHGDFDAEASAGSLLFTTKDGGAQLVGVQSLREILANRGIQVVFLNACDTGRDDIRIANRGVAQALVQAGLPSVVANQYKVLDPSAVAFAESFYRALAMGASIGQAARESRIAVNYSVDHELIDWAVPVVYARDPDHRLCPGGVVAASASPASKPKATRRTEAEASLHVGVADIGRYFPGLSEVLARLNEVQSAIRFRDVHVTAPLGAWNRVPGEGKGKHGKTYLHAERFAEKLRGRPGVLGVDLLLCVTNWWMQDDETLNIYAWWSGDPALRIAVFSTAGLSLPTSGMSGGRAVTNQIVAAIAAQLLHEVTGRSPIHDQPPPDCPFFYNPGRDVENIAGQLRFDAKCQTTLRNRLSPETCTALEALLTAWPDA